MQDSIETMLKRRQKEVPQPKQGENQLQTWPR